MEGTQKFVKAANKADLAPGTGKTVTVEGRCLALFNADGKYYAIDNTCPHRGGPLGEGSLNGNEITCPWHGWSFDVTSGQGTLNPAASVISYPVMEEGENILVGL